MARESAEKGPMIVCLPSLSEACGRCHRCLSPEQLSLLSRVFSAAVKAVSPDDPTGHLPNCGYTDEVPECGCAGFGRRLHAGLAEALFPPAQPGADQ